MQSSDSDRTPSVMNIRASAIDLRKLKATKHHKLILRLLRVHNEVNFAVQMSHRIEQSLPASKVAERLEHGIKWHLLRWRVSAAASAVEEVLKDFIGTKDKQNPELKKFIKARPELQKLWDNLSDYFPTGKFAKHTKRGKFIRDKLYAHFDSDILSKSFNKLIAIRTDEPLIGWHVQTPGEGKISRNLVIDELLNIALYQEYGIELSDQPVDPEEINKLGLEVTRLLEVISNFVNTFIIDYLTAEGVIVDEPPKSWLDDKF